MSREIRAGKAVVEIGLRDRLTQGLTGISRRLRSFGAVAAAAGGALVGGAGSVLGGLLAASKRFADAGSAVYDMSRRTGVAAGTLQELGFAAAQSGASLGDVETALRGMQRAIGRGTGKEALERLGLSLEEIRGLRPEEQFRRIADALARVADPTERAALAMQIFSRSGTAILPMLAEGTAGLDRMAAAAREAGIVLSEEDVAAADALGDAFDALKATIGGVVLQVGAALAPALTRLIGVLTDAAAGVVKWVAENRGLVVAVGAASVAVAAAGATLFAFGSAAIFAGLAIKSVGAIVTAFTATLSAASSPLALISAYLIAMSVAGVLAGITILHLTGRLDEGIRGLQLYAAAVKVMVRETLRDFADVTAAIGSDMTDALTDATKAAEELGAAVKDADAPVFKGTKRYQEADAPKDVPALVREIESSIAATWTAQGALGLALGGGAVAGLAEKDYVQFKQLETQERILKLVERLSNAVESGDALGLEAI